MKNNNTSISRLYHQLSRSIDAHPSSARTTALANQLEAVLSELKEGTIGSIFAAECRSLVSEAKGDMQNAIRHREEEIRLIRRLHSISQGTPGEEIAFSQYGFDDLRDRLELLAVLYHDSGQLNKALVVLEEAKRLCLEHEFPFEAEDILKEYLEERPSKTLYLWVSENGALSAREAESSLEATTMSSNSVAQLEQSIDNQRPAKKVSHQVIESAAPGASTPNSASRVSSAQTQFAMASSHIACHLGILQPTKHPESSP